MEMINIPMTRKEFLTLSMELRRKILERQALATVNHRLAEMGEPPIEPEVKEPVRPKIVCLLGSTRFTKQMLIRAWELTKQGIIVIHWAVLPDDYFKGEDKSHIADQENVKQQIDELYKRKIDLADECEVININGYIGESTRKEIEYAKAHNKVIRYLEANNGNDLPKG